jgi:hypothetical protein
MLERTIRECWDISDVRKLKSWLERLGRTKTPFYKQCQVWVRSTENGINDVEMGLNEAMEIGQGDYGHSFNMTKALDTINEKELDERLVCSRCFDIPKIPVVIDVSLSSKPPLVVLAEI